MFRRVSDFKDLARFARKTRKRLGLTQSDLAGVSGTSVPFIVDLERGKATAQIGKVLHVLRMLGIEVHLALKDGATHG